MSREEALQALRDVQGAMREQFPQATGRLEQLDSALSTAVMAIEHLHDEEERHEELLQRVVRTPRTLPAGHPDNHAERHGHQLRAGAMEGL